MKNSKSLVGVKLKNSSLARRSFKKKSSNKNIVRCPDCGAIAVKYKPFYADDESTCYCLSQRYIFGASITGLSGNRRNLNYEYYQCTKDDCKKIFKVRKKKGSHG